MDFWASVGVVGRRWYIAFPLLLITVAAAGWLALVTQRYQSTGTLLLTSPPVTIAPGSGSATVGPNPAQNPFNDFGSSLNTTGQILVQIVNSDAEAKAVQNAGGSGTFQIGTGAQPGPIITVQATAKRPGDALDTANLVAKAVRAELARLQLDTGAPKDTWIRADVLTAPENGRRQYGSMVRASGALLALGIVVSLSATFLVESMVRQRRRPTHLVAPSRATMGVLTHAETASPRAPIEGQGAFSLRGDIRR